MSGHAWAAQPAISDVAGTIQTGQTLTITGSDMMDENTAGWVSPTGGASAGFEGASAATDWGFATGGIGSTATVDTTVKLSGKQSAKFHIEGQHTGSIDHNPRASGIAGTDIITGKEFWARGYVRYNLNAGTWPANYFKMWWYGGNVFQPSETGGGYPSTFVYTIPGSDGTEHPVSIPSGQMQAGRWYCLEIHHKPNSIYEGWIDTTPVFSVAAGSNGFQWIEMGIINLDGTTAAFNMDHYEDNFALSTTARIGCSSIVEISNNPAYGSGTKVYQEPLFLSDTSIQIKANLSGLGSGPYFLWITNNLGTRSLGFQLGPTSGLPPPTNLKVQ